MREKVAFFKWSLGATLLAIAAAYVYRGLGAAGVVALLIGLELSISFDNAVVNATVLRRLSERWQQIFLTVGIVIAVFGMRVIFPVLIVAIATRLGTVEVVEQALTNRSEYAENVEKARPIIGAFGGSFLLLVAFNFFADRDRDVHWIPGVDRVLSRAGAIGGLPVAITGLALIVISQFVVKSSAEADVLLAGLVGIVSFLVVRGVSDAVERRYEEQISEGEGLTGRAAFFSFLYLEMLDASFSMDGVIGAFAVTADIVLIGLGLGVGALYVRSLTVYLVRRETLGSYQYLTHGAHWAIAALAAVLLVSTRYHVAEWVTGAIGLGFIIAALVTSIVHNRRHGADG